MSALAARGPDIRDDALAARVLAHMDEQLASARSLLAVVLDQGAAIRARDVQTVVRLAGILRGEIERRELLDEQRALLLAECGQRIGLPAEAVTLGALQKVMSAPDSERAGALSSELKGLLGELQREHSCNRTLMQIELGFLDQLMSLLALDGTSGYDPQGSSKSISTPRHAGALHVLDLRA